MQEKKTFAIVGAGAVGSYYGAKLAHSGHKVFFYSRAAKSAGVQKLKIKSIRGDFAIKAEFYDSTNMMPPVDFVVISLKALPNIDYPSLLSPLLKPNSEILLLQNGINGEEKLARLFPQNIIHGGLAFTCINRLRPDLIDHSDYGLIKMAPLHEKHYAHTRKLADMFSRADIETVASKKLRQIRWEKLLWNIPFNPLSVILGGVTTDIIMQDPASRALAADIMAEVRAIAVADGCKITPAHIKDMLARTDHMAPYKTSMLLDYLSGREMEIQAITGEPLATASRLQVAAPRLAMLDNLLKFHSRNNRR